MSNTLMTLRVLAIVLMLHASGAAYAQCTATTRRSWVPAVLAVPAVFAVSVARAVPAVSAVPEVALKPFVG